MDMQWTDPANLTQQMIEFQKATFDNTFDAMVLLQNRAERIAASLEPSWGVPGETQKLIDDWVKAFNQSRDEYKKMVHQGFDCLEKLFAPPEEAEPAAKPQIEAAKEPEKKPAPKAEVKATEPAKEPAQAAEKAEKEELGGKQPSKPTPKSK